MVLYTSHILLHDCHWLSYIFSQTHKQIYSCPLHPVLGSQRYAIPNPAASRSPRRGEGRYLESIYTSPSLRSFCTLTSKKDCDNMCGDPPGLSLFLVQALWVEEQQEDQGWLPQHDSRSSLELKNLLQHYVRI